MTLEIGQRVFRVGNISGGAQIAAIDGDSCVIEYDEGGSGSWPVGALAATIDDAITAPLGDVKVELIEAAARLRRAKEVGTVSVSGHMINADERTRANLTAAALAAVIDTQYTVRWKMADGDFVDFTAPQIIAAAQAVRVYVQGCFDREKTLVDAINAAATLGDLAAIDINSGWPS